jgi:ribosome-associated protein
MGAAGARASAPAPGGRADETGPDALLSLILSSLDDDGAVDVVTIDLAGKSTIADHMVVATGRSSRHVAAISEKLVERLKAEAGVVPRIEGKEAADWVLIDAGDAIVHVFRPEVREFYQIEKMWQPEPDRAARPS